MQELRHKLASLREQWEAEKLGMGDVQPKPASSSQQVELEFDQLRAAIKEKQAAGQPIAEKTITTSSTNSTCERKAAVAASSKPSRHRARRPPRRHAALLRQEVGPEEIAEVVSAWTGIPVTRHDRNRTGQAAGARRTAAPARRRPGRSGRGRGERRPPQPLGLARSESADRLVHLSWARPASARPSFARRWPRCCSTTKTPWSGST